MPQNAMQAIRKPTPAIDQAVTNTPDRSLQPWQSTLPRLPTTRVPNTASAVRPRITLEPSTAISIAGNREVLRFMASLCSTKPLCSMRNTNPTPDAALGGAVSRSTFAGLARVAMTAVIASTALSWPTSPANALSACTSLVVVGVRGSGEPYTCGTAGMGTVNYPAYEQIKARVPDAQPYGLPYQAVAIIPDPVMFLPINTGRVSTSVRSCSGTSSMN